MSETHATARGRFSRSRASGFGLAALAALALGGCLTDQVSNGRPDAASPRSARPTPGRPVQYRFAVRRIRRNPSTRRPITPAAPPTPASGISRRRWTTSPRRSGSIPIISRPTPIARWPIAKAPQRSRESRFRPRHLGQSRHAPAYIGRANLLRAQGNLDQARADSTPPSGSIPRTRRRSTRAGSSTRSRATIFAP